VQVTIRVEDRGSEPVAIGGRSLQATRLLLTEPGGASREVWADANGRVLRVVIASRGIVAERDEAPR
jgi:hypothetical protein